MRTNGDAQPQMIFNATLTIFDFALSWLCDIQLTYGHVIFVKISTINLKSVHYKSFFIFFRAYKENLFSYHRQKSHTSDTTVK